MKRTSFIAGIVCVAVLGCGPKQQQEPPLRAASMAPMASQELAMSDPAGKNPSTNPSTNPAPATQPRQTTFTGILRGRVMAVGAETTGWRLERDDGPRVDVSVTKIRDKLDGLEGKRVVIHGVIATVNWPERRSQQLLMAESIEPAAEK
jgi:hypothetical protein